MNKSRMNGITSENLKNSKLTAKSTLTNLSLCYTVDKYAILVREVPLPIRRKWTSPFVSNNLHVVRDEHTNCKLSLIPPAQT